MDVQSGRVLECTGMVMTIRKGAELCRDWLLPRCGNEYLLMVEGG